MGGGRGDEAGEVGELCWVTINHLSKLEKGWVGGGMCINASGLGCTEAIHLFAFLLSAAYPGSKKHAFRVLT